MSASQGEPPTPTPSHLNVHVSGLAHEFVRGQPLFTDVAFDARPGELLALVGPSGSGKSTMLSILAGWVTPTAGTVTRTGVTRIAWVFQNPHGVNRRTALDHVVLPLLAKGYTRTQAEPQAHAILERFHLDHRAMAPYVHLSGGEAQRLMLARAVAVAPSLLLVDEPTAQLDARTSATVNAVLAELAADSTIVVVATHDPDTRDSCTHVLDLGHTDPAVTATRCATAPGGAA